jgi:precorrin-6y C5,15-methyltransferase (decarboxylating) CbiE subunit
MAMEEKKKIVIVGCGPGSVSLLTGAGKQAISEASVLAGASDLLERFAEPHHGRICFGGNGGLDLAGLLEEVDRRGRKERVAVLVSGDPGIGSLARSVLQKFGKGACRVIPGISSVQLAFARLGLDWTNARIVSAHREVPDLSPEALSDFGIVAILGGHRQAQGWIADLAEDLGGGRALVVCQDLSRAEEKIERVSVAEFRFLPLSTRTIALIVQEELLSWA